MINMADHNDSTSSDDQFAPHLPPRYRNLIKLDGGGMAELWKADEVNDIGELVHRVAIKFLSDGDEPARVEQFRHELKIIAALDHPHILPVYTFNVSAEQLYLVMPLADGTLAERLLTGQVEKETALRWLNQLADALDYAH
jgi:serine/threonine-protein kinase